MQTAPGRRCRIARLCRALGLDGNPLRRASDRAEACIRAGLVAAFLIVGPMAATAVGHWASHAEVSRASTQTHAHPAVPLQPAAGPGGLAPVGQGGPRRARAQVEGVDGFARTGEMPVPTGTSAETVATVWPRAPARVATPPGPGATASVTASATVAALAIVALALLALLRLIQWCLNWRRLAAWEAAWAATGPRWTGHAS